MIMTSRRKFLRAVLLIMICLYANSDLIGNPKDVEAVVGGTTFFNCSTTIVSGEIHWFHYAIGDTKDRSFVYGYDQFYSRYLGRFQMEKNVATGSYNLIISTVTVDDAGRYECQDDSGRGDKDSAQLTVLDENPVCQSNIKPQGLIGPNICGFEPDTLHLTCSVQYYGNQPPMMQWREVGSNSPIEEGITHNASSDRAIYYLKMKVNSLMDGSSYQCVTTRSTQSQYGCASGVVSVKGFSGMYVVIICVLVSVVLVTVAALAGFKVGRIRRDPKMKQKGPTKNSNKEQSPQRKEPEEMELIGKQDKEPVEKLKTDKETTDKVTTDKETTETLKTEKETTENLTSDKETIEILTAENIRLLAKVNELEQQMYCIDNKATKTVAKLAHTIVTKTAEKMKGPTSIIGMAILDNNLFVVKKNYPDVEIYNSETFVYVRLLKKLDFANPLGIASSRKNKFLYVIDRANSESESIIWKFNTAGEGAKKWQTEKDNGRLSTYESNLIWSPREFMKLYKN